MKYTASLACIVASLVAAGQQEKDDVQPCKARFAIFQLNPHIPGGIAPGFSKEMGRWFQMNKAKFPTVCLDGEKPDYFVLWSSRFSSSGAPEPTINFGALTGNVGGRPLAAS